MKQVFWTIIFTLAFGATIFAQTETVPCPKIEVTGGGVVEVAQPMTFTVNVAGLTDASNLKFEWSISNGTISSGQGTASITVDTTGLSDQTNITATVKVVGLPENCSNTASETGALTPRCILPRIFDEFGKLSNNDVLARIQNLYVELANDSEMRAYIINYGNESEFAARKRQIESAISRLKLDSSRVRIVNGGANPRGKDVWTRVYIVPKNVDVSPLTEF